MQQRMASVWPVRLPAAANDAFSKANVALSVGLVARAVKVSNKVDVFIV